MVVPRRAIGFYDQLLGAPPKIGNDATAAQPKRNIHVRMLEAATKDQVEDRIFELAPRGRGAGLEDAGERPSSPPWPEPRKHLRELAHVHKAERLRLTNSPSQDSELNQTRKVEQRSSGRRDGNSTMPGYVLAVKRLRTVDPEPAMLTSSAFGDRRLGEAIVPGNEVPERRSREMAKDGMVAARLDGCQQPSFKR